MTGTALFLRRSCRSGCRPPGAGVVSTALATAAILIMAVLLLGYIVWMGASQLTPRFLLGGRPEDMFQPGRAGILPMVLGTAARVMVMTLFVMPVGVVTAVYLAEYARPSSLLTRFIRAAVFNLAGVPSIVFGLFGVGFFISFLGNGLDHLTGSETPHFGRPALLWASLTLAVMTLPVVIVATEESLRALAPGTREASFALGATRLQTVMRVVLPNALPGILTAAILAVSRAAGEVAPILFTGAAYYLQETPGSLTDQFMDLAYHVFILATQSPDVERTTPILFGSVLVLLLLTSGLHLAAGLLRSRIRLRPAGGIP